MILFIVFCNGIIYYYNQLEKKYIECLVEKESFFFEIFPIKNCENRMSLFNVSDKYKIQFTIFFSKAFIETICDICHSFGLAFGKILNAFFSELLNGMSLFDYVILWSYIYPIGAIIIILISLYIFLKYKLY